MQAAILTVGDELLTGETQNTNATWLASEIASRGVSVERILTVPDDRAVIGNTVARWHTTFDRVIVTGGLGDTPDDVTMEAVASALGRDLVVDQSVKSHLRERARRLREKRPELFEEYDFDLDVDRAATVPAGAKTITTDAGWAPACVVENVYVFAGFPDELRAAFEHVVDDFDGERLTKAIHTPEPEGALTARLEAANDRFDVSIGSYPRKDDTPGEIRVSGIDERAVDDAIDWLRANVETTVVPEE